MVIQIIDIRIRRDAPVWNSRTPPEISQTLPSCANRLYFLTGEERTDSDVNKHLQLFMRKISGFQFIQFFVVHSLQIDIFQFEISCFFFFLTNDKNKKQQRSPQPFPAAMSMSGWKSCGKIIGLMWMCQKKLENWFANCLVSKRHTSRKKLKTLLIDRKEDN